MSDGATIRVRQHGNVDGPRVFMSHGNGFAIDGYVAFWQPLATQFELIIFDFRNHGHNPPSPAADHHYAQMADDVEQILRGVDDHLGQKPAIGAFHSMSARAAMKHAVEIGWRWQALVLFDPPNMPPPGHPQYAAMIAFEDKLVQFADMRRSHFDDPSELAEHYASSRAHAGWVNGAHAAMAQAVLRQDPQRGDWTLVCPGALEASIYAAASTLNLWPNADEFGGPVALIGSDPERTGPPPTGAANRALADEGGYWYRGIADTGHLLQIEKPKQCRAAMLAFLSESGVLT
jgi:pimeloyl-ACP methyl ester carboxylesterase